MLSGCLGTSGLEFGATQKISTRIKTCKLCSKLTIKTPERRQQRRFGVFIVNFERISPVFLLWTLKR